MRSAADPMVRNAMWQDAQAQVTQGPAKGAGALAPGVIGEAGGAAFAPGQVGGVPQGKSFDSLLGDFVSEVNAKQLDSADATRALLAGEKIPLHRVMIAAEEASVSFQLMVEVRNKVLESYQELMRMQI